MVGLSKMTWGNSPLREDSKGNQNDESVAITRSSPEFRPGISLKLLLQRERLLDLLVLDLNNFVLFVSTSMVFGENVERFFAFTF